MANSPEGAFLKITIYRSKLSVLIELYKWDNL